MQPPIPEVPKVSPPSNAKPAFFGLNVAVGVGLIAHIIVTLHLFHYLSEYPFKATWIRQFSYSMQLMDITAYATILFFLRQRYNWARWAMIVWSVLSLILFCIRESSPDGPSTLLRMCNAFDSFWSVGLGIWLLFPNVAQHFKTPKPT